MAKLSNKIVLITGGTSGIGLATAQLFIEEGAQVIVTGCNLETLAQARATLGSAADVIKADTADLQAVEELLSDIKVRYSRIDLLFVNAGVSQFAPLAQTTSEIFDRHFDINVRGAYFTIQNALPLIPGGGAILINASVVASMGTPTATAYSASKAALRSFGRTLAAELAPRIRVNIVSPGLIDTPTYSKMGMPPEAAKAFAEQMVRLIPMKRFGHAQEVAKAALFLLSNDSSYITGTELFVDGGVVGVGAASGMLASAQ